MKPIILIGLLLLISGCGKTYQSVAVENLKMQPHSYDQKQITISGIPSPPQRGDFSSPTPLHGGYWTFVINGVRCAEMVNFENEPRIRSMVKMLVAAEQAGRPIKVSGKMKGQILDIASVEGIGTNTPWYKNRSPYYSYSQYYEWSPFAYSPNVLTSKAWGAKAAR